MSIYVVGHKNPDTDAICSAIGYANLLSQTTMPEAIPAACGPANTRTEFVLEQAGLDMPVLLVDVRPKASDLGRRKPLYALINEPLFDVYQRMQRHGLRAIPMLNKEGVLVGMLTLLDLLDMLLPDSKNLIDQRVVETSLSRIRHVLKGRFYHEVEPEASGRMLVMVGAMKEEDLANHLKKVPAEKVVLITGNRENIHKVVIEAGVRCLIITGSFAPSDEVLELAKKQDVSILGSPMDTAMTTLMVKTARYIEEGVTRECLSFSPQTKLKEVQSKVRGSTQTTFPVLDEQGKLVGIFSKTDLVEPPRARLIMVDHNEFGQAVDGAEDADILEVIDHHRIGGGLNSRKPIRFINETVGSTCSIITGMFRDKAIIPEAPIALCLAAGIISDTLNLTSPTTTETDKELLAWLAPYTNVDIQAFAEAFFAAGSALRSLTAKEIVESDCKTYKEDGYFFSVAQIEELDMELFWEREDELQEALESFRSDNNLDFSCLMVTDISNHYSILQFVGDATVKKSVDFPVLEGSLFEMRGVVSRKKQLLPALIWSLKHLEV